LLQLRLACSPCKASPAELLPPTLARLLVERAIDKISSFQNIRSTRLILALQRAQRSQRKYFVHLVPFVVDFSSHCARTFFMRSTTSGGWTTTFFAMASSSCPVTGSISQFRFCASALNSGSARALISASRNIVNR